MVEPHQTIPTRQALPPADGEAFQGAPFRHLGRDGSGYAYQIVQNGRIVRLPVASHTSLQLCDLAPLAYWETMFPARTGVNWTAAASVLMVHGKDAGAFDPNRIRGRGVWLDGGRAIHHLGDRLTVDGAPADPAKLSTDSYYDARPPLTLATTEDELTDAEGQQLLTMLQALKWAHPSDHLHLAGIIVLGPLSGDLTLRPQAQITGETSTGKTVIIEDVIRPLWGGDGACHYFSKASEAGIRQKLGGDSLPVLIDESEQADPKRRAAIVSLARHSYDGVPVPRGTAHGQALEYTVRSLMVLAGINATLPNPADRNRFVILRRGAPSKAEWSAAIAALNPLCTPLNGARLIRRTTTHLKTLLGDAGHLWAAVEAMIPGRIAGRIADTMAPVLAGARLLTTTKPLTSPADAAGWLDSVGWSFDAGDDEALAGDAEAQQCLDHGLSHLTRWEGPSGQITLRELVKFVQGAKGIPTANITEAAAALARNGIRVDGDSLLIANSGRGIQRLYENSRWANGAHRDRLRALPGAEPIQRRIPGVPNRKCTLVPLSLIQALDDA